MKQNVGPIALIAAVALIGVVIFFLYKASNPSNLGPYQKPVWHGMGGKPGAGGYGSGAPGNQPGGQSGGTNKTPTGAGS